MDVKLEETLAALSRAHLAVRNAREAQRLHVVEPNGWMEYLAAAHALVRAECNLERTIAAVLERYVEIGEMTGVAL